MPIFFKYGSRRCAFMYVKYVKRFLDAFLSLMGLIVLAIPMLVIAIAVKIDDPGPAFFKQKRVGKEKKYFELYKFRSMKVNTPDVPTHQLENPKQYISKVGAFLRKTSLDELPQMWNILKGDVSIIGDGCIIETTKKSIDFSRVVTV